MFKWFRREKCVHDWKIEKSMKRYEITWDGKYLSGLIEHQVCTKCGKERRKVYE